MNNEERILSLLERMDTRLETMEGRIDSLEGNMLDKFEKMDTRLETIEGRMGAFETRLITVEDNGKTTGKLLDLVATQVNKLTIDMEEVKVKLDQKADKTDIVRLENTILPKIDALFDGQQLHSEKLERIEQEVSRQEEVILRRLK